MAGWTKLRQIVIPAALLAALTACVQQRWPQAPGGSFAAVPGWRASPPPLVSASSGRITVAPGDTLYGLARRYRVPVRAMIAANHLAPPYTIRVGERLALPLPVETAQRSVPPPAPVFLARHPPSRPEWAAAPPPPPPSQPRWQPPRAAPAEMAMARRKPPPMALQRQTLPPAAVGRPLRSAVPVPVAEEPPPPPAASVPPLAPPPVASNFLWPVRGRILASYGPGADGMRNDGINIAAPQGTPVLAAAAGTVAYAGNELRGYGNLVLIKHEDGFMTAYAHNQVLLVRRGERVRRGQIIARVGMTGAVSTPQLHFEIRRGTRPLDPVSYLPALSASAAGS